MDNKHACAACDCRSAKWERAFFDLLKLSEDLIHRLNDREKAGNAIKAIDKIFKTVPAVTPGMNHENPNKKR